MTWRTALLDIDNLWAIVDEVDGVNIATADTVDLVVVPPMTIHKKTRYSVVGLFILPVH